MDTIIAPTTCHSDNNNPLLQEWHTPFGTPPFSIIRNEHYLPAIRTAMAMAQEELHRIVENDEAPSFANTIEALEATGRRLNRITSLLFNLDECHTNDELSEIVMTITPELTRFDNQIWMNEALFARVKQVYETEMENPHRTAEQQMLIEKSYKAFVRNGVNLSADDKEEYRRNSEELAQLSVQFNKNVLADDNAFALNVADASRLSGIPDNILAEAHEEATRRGQEGWIFTLAYPIYGPVLQYADDRALREEMYRAYNTRGNRNNEHNNGNIIRRMTALRLRQAQLLGYPDYLSYKLDNTMAKQPAVLNDFMTRLIHAAYPAAERDLRQVQDWLQAHGDTTLLQRWDFSYYAEKLKQEKYSYDSEALRPYFQLEKVRQGIFDLYGKLYGITFCADNEIEVYHPDVTAYTVHDGDKVMGVLYLDMFPRESKRSGAWMTEFRGQCLIGNEEQRPQIQVVCNFTKPVGDTPSLLTFDEVETFMHEMGHAMHGMLSQVSYESLSGTNVYRDFVEMPSQLMENWCREADFLQTFAQHYKTGETLPADLLDKMRNSDQYLSGWLCLRQLSLGLADLAYHTISQPLEENIYTFERHHMIELLPGVEGCNTSTAFTHLFSGGYAAGYYSYKWSEMLDADIFDQFRQHGLFNRDYALRFRHEVLSKGGSEDPSTLFRNFVGRDPDLQAYLLRDGLVDANVPVAE